MFTGIIESVGTVQWLKQTERATELRLDIGKFDHRLALGDSLAVNGCCLTLVSAKGGSLYFDLLEETLRRTNLSKLRPGDLVNLERPLAADGRLGGHFVQGHVDAVVAVRSLEKAGMDYRLEIELPGEFAAQVVLKGSIAINGVSLTLSEIHADRVAVWLIPHTLQVTNLRALQPDSFVNVEYDILAKYVARMKEVHEHQS